MKNIKDIKTVYELAWLLGVKLSELKDIISPKNIAGYYTEFSIPKKSGGTRQILAPCDQLKEIQTKLSNLLYKSIEEHEKDSNISHGFVKNKNIITNAKIHRNKRFVINIDLENFFESIHFGRISGFFEKDRDFSMPHPLAIMIAQIACYNGHLPQGAPCSPVITNLICRILDYRLLKLAKHYKLDYTRYADDLTFSTNYSNFDKDWPQFLDAITKEINKAGFTVNNKKTRIQFHNSRQMVTGLVVNKKINIQSQYYKKVRAMSHTLFKDGKFLIENSEGSLNQLEGMLSFIYQLNKFNHVETKYTYTQMNAKEKLYCKFLFYKYFFANNMPLIVTEGKTDILYIKSALKNLYLEYPSLITKNEDGTFDFKISFLHRSDRLKELFGFGKDGADAIKKLYNFFSGKEKYPNLIKEFSNDNKQKPISPVIFVLDNELSNKSKPIHNLLNHCKSIDADRQQLENNLTLNVCSNLFITIPPLVALKKECEIEDLFTEDTLSEEINGKTFCRDDSFDRTKNISKDIFSKHIAHNYSSIDFSNFRTLLNNIKKIVDEYKISKNNA